MQANNYICNGEFCVLNHGNYSENEVNQEVNHEVNHEVNQEVNQEYGVCEWDFNHEVKQEVNRDEREEDSCEEEEVNREYVCEWGFLNPLNLPKIDLKLVPEVIVSNKEIYLIKENDDILGYTFSETQCIDFINKYFEDFKNRNMGSNYILERRSESSFIILEDLFINFLVSSYQRTVCSLSFVIIKGI